MDTTALERLSDQELMALADGARGLPFGTKIQAVIDARLAALEAQLADLKERARQSGYELAQEILMHQDAEGKWFFIDHHLECDDGWLRSLVHHALDALREAYYIKTYVTDGRLLLKGSTIPRH